MGNKSIKSIKSINNSVPSLKISQPTSQDTSFFSELPIDIRNLILGDFFDVQQIGIFMQVCRTYYFFGRQEAIWKRQCFKLISSSEYNQRLKDNKGDWPLTVRDVLGNYVFDPVFAAFLNQRFICNSYDIQFFHHNRTVAACSGLTDWLTAPTKATLDRVSRCSFRIVNYPTSPLGNNTNSWKLIVGILYTPTKEAIATERFWIGNNQNQFEGFGIISESGFFVGPPNRSSAIPYASKKFQKRGNVIDVIANKTKSGNSIEFRIDGQSFGEAYSIQTDIFKKEYCFAVSLSSNILEVEVLPFREKQNESTIPKISSPTK